MTPTAVILIVISAFMHAFWNLVSKRNYPSLAFFFVASVAAALLVSPLLVRYGDALPQMPGAIWLLVLATGIAQAVYFTGLAGAYRRGDISLAYPLARALPVLMVAGVNLALGRGAVIGRLGLAGMVLIFAGCLVLPLPSFRRLHGYVQGVALLALVAAVGTTGYTLIDDAALRQMRSILPQSTAAVTALYVALQTASTALFLGATTLLYPVERGRLRELVARPSRLGAAAGTGVIIMVTYALVLASMAYVRNVSYVAAFRQLSIPIGAFLGIALQGEPPYRPKLVGVASVTVGLVFVAVG